MIGAIHGMLGVTSVRFYDQLSSCAVALSIAVVSLHYLNLALVFSMRRTLGDFQSANVAVKQMGVNWAINRIGNFILNQLSNIPYSSSCVMQ